MKVGQEEDKQLDGLCIRQRQEKQKKK